MVYINEWLPNPVGADAAGEFVELYNSATGAVNLSRWKLGAGTLSSSTGAIVAAKSPKSASLNGYSIAAGGYLVLRHAQTKLTLKNSDGALLLYGPDGRVADAASFEGSAPVGESFSRVSYDTSPAQHFAFTDPTPGAPNAPFDTAVTAVRYREGVPLDSQAPPAATLTQGIALAAAIALAFIYVLKKNDHLSRLLFGGNGTSR